MLYACAIRFVVTKILKKIVKLLETKQDPKAIRRAFFLACRRD